MPLEPRPSVPTVARHVPGASAGEHRENPGDPPPPRLSRGPPQGPRHVNEPGSRVTCRGLQGRRAVAAAPRRFRRERRRPCGARGAEVSPRRRRRRRRGAAPRPRVTRHRGARRAAILLQTQTERSGRRGSASAPSPPPPPPPPPSPARRPPPRDPSLAPPAVSARQLRGPRPAAGPAASPPPTLRAGRAELREPEAERGPPARTLPRLLPAGRPPPAARCARPPGLSPPPPGCGSRPRAPGGHVVLAARASACPAALVTVAPAGLAPVLSAPGAAARPAEGAATPMPHVPGESPHPGCLADLAGAGGVVKSKRAVSGANLDAFPVSQSTSAASAPKIPAGEQRWCSLMGSPASPCRPGRTPAPAGLGLPAPKPGPLGRLPDLAPRHSSSRATAPHTRPFLFFQLPVSSAWCEPPSLCLLLTTRDTKRSSALPLLLCHIRNSDCSCFMPSTKNADGPETRLAGSSPAL
ncbi:formin-like protein 5 [Choloepus didactylus]|uniref:formin-like protein 5 n=1 Tax=Choloepus didactylus TaxID=27675 RepID=UPI00189E771C|nr:formin-like protein 5 [Choloepus didactylus]